MKATDEERLAYDAFVHTPTQGTNALKWLAEEIYGTVGISTGSAVLDDLVIPTRPGWVRYWLARPGEGKTTMLRVIAMTEARRLIAAGLTDKFYVAFLTWEESVESQELYFHNRSYTNDEFWRGLVSPERVMREGIKRPQLPIYLFGNSMIKSTINTPPMTVERAIDGMRAVYNIENKRPSLIVGDYVQEIEVEHPSGNRTQDVIVAMKSIIQMGIVMKCPTELGVQAKQTSLDEADKVPDQRHIEYSFLIHQKATNGVSVARPWVYESNALRSSTNPEIEIGKGKDKIIWPLTPNLMIARPTKHRPGILGLMVLFELFPDTLKIKDFAKFMRK